MFTGIVEEVGVVHSVVPGAKSAVVTVEAGKVLEGTKVGDSIAVNGVCLTVTELMGNRFQADVMAETLRRSSLQSLRHGSRVNLERAMAADGRFGGHIVAGHIDGTGRIVSMTREDNAVWVKIETTPRIMRYIIEKGSIAIDGISLTVAVLEKDSFAVSVIPHTGQETTLLDKKPGDVVNLENDLVGKYVERLLSVDTPGEQETTDENAQDRGITLEMLKQYGF
jgi:riboflavin synthase